jgi:hypothetical protein
MKQRLATVYVALDKEMSEKIDPDHDCSALCRDTFYERTKYCSIFKLQNSTSYIITTQTNENNEHFKRAALPMHPLHTKDVKHIHSIRNFSSARTSTPATSTTPPK